MGLEYGCVGACRCWWGGITGENVAEYCFVWGSTNHYQIHERNIIHMLCWRFPFIHSIKLGFLNVITIFCTYLLHVCWDIIFSSYIALPVRSSSFYPCTWRMLKCFHRKYITTRTYTLLCQHIRSFGLHIRRYSSSTPVLPQFYKCIHLWCMAIVRV